VYHLKSYNDKYSFLSYKETPLYVCLPNKYCTLQWKAHDIFSHFTAWTLDTVNMGNGHFFWLTWVIQLTLLYGFSLDILHTVHNGHHARITSVPTILARCSNSLLPNISHYYGTVFIITNCNSIKEWLVCPSLSYGV